MEISHKESQVSPERVASHLEVLTPDQFLADFKLEAAKAQHKVIAQTTQIEADRVGEQVLDIFNAAPEGVDKQLYVDYHAKIFSGGMPIINEAIPSVAQQARVKRESKEALFQQFQERGVSIRIMNEPEIPPKRILGKMKAGLHVDHIKAAQVDDRVFYLGGFNFVGEAAQAADFMVKITGNPARKLAEVLELLHSNNSPKENFLLDLGEGMQLLVDVGASKESLIIDEARALIGSAERSVQMTSQWVPDAPIAQGLSDATQQGKQVEVITSSKPRIESILPITYSHGTKLFDIENRFHNWRKKFRVPLLVDRVRKVHAKLLLVDGKLALFGSHNFSHREARHKVVNWSIMTTNPQLVHNLQQWYKGLRKETE